MALVDEVGAGPVALDTAPFIYLIEEHETFLPIVEPVFAAIDAGRLTAVMSALTLLEVLVVPLRAVTGMRTPDAIQVATALQHGCTSFVTNDCALPAPPGLRILRVSDFLPPGRTRSSPRVRER